MLLAILKVTLIIVEILSSLLLIGVILMQQSKSQGMGVAFGSGVGESIFGAQMGNVLTKATVFLTVIFLINTTFLAMLYSSRTNTIGESIRSGPVEVKQVQPQDMDRSAASTENQTDSEKFSLDMDMTVEGSADVDSGVAVDDSAVIDAESGPDDKSALPKSNLKE